MSFLLPISEFDASGSCLLEPDALTPELIALLGLSDGETPVFVLWGGSALCTDRLLCAIADEADNRSLKYLVCFSPFPLPPYRRRAIWVEGVGILKSAAALLPDRCRLIDLSSLAPPLSDEDESALASLRAKADKYRRECIGLGKAAAMLGQAELTLTEPLHALERMAQKTARIASGQPIVSSGHCSIPVTTVTAGGETIRMLPFDKKTQIIGLREQYGVAARFLTLLADALEKRSADYLRLTDALSGELCGIWLPSSTICYLTDPPERRQKIMTLGRYLAPRSPIIRKRYRTLDGCRKLIGSEIAALTAEIASITAEIDRIESKNLQNSRFGEFRKRLLIELYCK